MKEEIRVKINESNQKELFKKFKEKLNLTKNCSKRLRIKEGTYKGYANLKVRYIPKRILKKVCKILREPLPKIKESKTLKEIRQSTIKRTYPILREKYGENWEKVLAKRGHLSLEKKFGKDWRRVLAKRGHKTSKKRYGKNFQKIFWNRALLSLERKYGKDYHKKLFELSNIVKKRPLTSQEKQICEQLKKIKIPFEAHCIKNNKEFDIIIPNLENPKIIIECSNSKPSMNLERLKILQLIEQKETFPKAIHLAIFKKEHQNLKFTTPTYNFLTKEGINIFWYKDMNLVIKMIKDYLEMGDKKLLEFKYNYKKEEIRFPKTNKLNKDELKLNKLLLKLNANPESQKAIRTKYGNVLIPDNYEEINNLKLAYEITSAKNYHALLYLAGKVIYLKKCIKDLKVIVILNNKNELNERRGSKSLLKHADAVILKNQFNKRGLEIVRNNLIKIPNSSKLLQDHILLKNPSPARRLKR